MNTSLVFNNYKEHMNRLYIISMYLLSLVHYVALEGKLAIIATVGGLPD